MDRQEMERRLQLVAAYRASGQKANVWGEANGLSLRVLSSWCAHRGAGRHGLTASAPEPCRHSGRVVSWPPAWRRLPHRHRCASSCTRVRPDSSCIVHWLTRANSPRCFASSADDSHRDHLAGAGRQRLARRWSRRCSAGGASPTGASSRAAWGWHPRGMPAATARLSRASARRATSERARCWWS